MQRAGGLCVRFGVSALAGREAGAGSRLSVAASLCGAKKDRLGRRSSRWARWLLVGRCGRVVLERRRHAAGAERAGQKLPRASKGDGGVDWRWRTAAEVRRGHHLGPQTGLGWAMGEGTRAGGVRSNKIGVKPSPSHQ
jgi:hypothetical protein